MGHLGPRANDLVSAALRPFIRLSSHAAAPHLSFSISRLASPQKDDSSFEASAKPKKRTRKKKEKKKKTPETEFPSLQLVRVLVCIRHAKIFGAQIILQSKWSEHPNP